MWLLASSSFCSVIQLNSQTKLKSLSIMKKKIIKQNKQKKATFNEALLHIWTTRMQERGVGARFIHSVAHRIVLKYIKVNTIYTDHVM